LGRHQSSPFIFNKLDPSRIYQQSENRHSLLRSIQMPNFNVPTPSPAISPQHTVDNGLNAHRVMAKKFLANRRTAALAGAAELPEANHIVKDPTVIW
jgi:hypothetical protein